MNKLNRIVKLFTSLFALVLVLGMGAFFVDVADAATIFCRSDPIIFLTDGTRVQFEALMATVPEDVIEVRYELHGPVGVQVRREIHIPSPVSDKETFTYYADQPAGQYRVVVTVFTSSNDVLVKARARISARDGRNVWRERSVLDGLSNRSISIVFQQP